MEPNRRAIILAAVIAYLETKKRRTKHTLLQREAAFNAWRIGYYIDISEQDILAAY
ncbi:MAG: hypothetical protein QXX32_04250 [Thermofilum sp.]|jgi:hypothetical protein|nr:hypothetical protein [Thermofilum adornatum]MCC5997800.1 hypothetical protein [Thermofilum sp.]